MRKLPNKFSNLAIAFVLVMASLSIGVRPFKLPKADAAYMGTRSLELSDSRAAQTNVTYDVSYTVTTPGTIGSVEIEFCSNSTFVTDPCTAPAGLDASGAVLASQTGVTGFSISGASTANDIILTRAPAAAGAGLATAVFNNVTNPNTEGSYFVRVITYQTNDASGPLTDNGGIAFAINGDTNVAVTVPPYLLLCVGITISGTDCSTVSGDFIDLGNFSTSGTSSGQSQMVVATNGQNGYGISASGTTMESGNNIIPAMSVSGPATPGVSQFGINLRANSSPHIGANPSGTGSGSPVFNYNQPNLYHYSDGDTLASKSSPDNLRKFTVSYIVDVGSSQAVGVYSSTYTYVALANF